MVEIEVQNYAKEAGSVKYLPNSWNLVICPSFQVVRRGRYFGKLTRIFWLFT